MTSLWHITLFAQLTVQRAEEEPISLTMRKSGSLLAYLAYHIGRPQSREFLADLLWPEAQTAKEGREHLRSSLHELRKRLDAPHTPLDQSAVLSTRATLCLNPTTASIDVALYQQAMERAKRASSEEETRERLQQAVALYGGELLRELSDEWVLSAREMLLRQQQNALEQLLTLHENAGDIAQAIDMAQRTVFLDTTDDTAHCRLMRLYLADGRYSAALAQYEQLKRVLKRTLDAEPSNVAQKLVREAKARLKPASVAVASRRAPALLSPPNLPCPLPRFFGRDNDIKSLQVLLTRPGTRLVTLTGMGGSGKSHLALETARKAQDAFGGRVFWVELAAIQEASGILSAIATTLLRQRRPNVAPLKQLAQDGADQDILLVLDNFEHLADAGTFVIQELLQALPCLILMVTSRQRLSLRGEQPFPVHCLPLDHSRDLFADRAGMVQPDFALDDVNTEVINTLCQRLEGIPLALELAAGWMDMLPPAEILAGLENRFALLVSPYKDVPDRHRSLSAMIESSYVRLTTDLKQVFTCLSVFCGGWTLEAAQAVCQTPDVVHALRQLQEKSLIVARGEAAAERNRERATRFRLLETLREFAEACLSEAERALCADRHAAYFLHLAEQAEPHLQDAQQTLWLDRLEADNDNLRAALEHLLRTDQVNSVQRLVYALVRFWQLRGHVMEGRQQIARCLAVCIEATSARAQILRYAGNLADFQSDYAASKDLYAKSLATAQQINDESLITWALYALGHNSLATADFADAQCYLMESLHRFTLLGEQRGEAFVQHKLGSLLLAQGDFDRAEGHFQHAADLHAELGNSHSQAISLLNIGNVRVNQGDLAEANVQYARSLAFFETTGDICLAAVVQSALGSTAMQTSNYTGAQVLLERSLAAHRQSGARDYEAWALYFLGTLAVKRDDSRQAREYYRESLTIFHALGNQARIAVLLFAFAHLAQMENDAERAARLFGASAALLTRIKATILPNTRGQHEAALAATCAALDETAFAFYWAEGEALELTQAVAYALQTTG